MELCTGQTVEKITDQKHILPYKLKRQENVKRCDDVITSVRKSYKVSQNITNPDIAEYLRDSCLPYIFSLLVWQHQAQDLRSPSRCKLYEKGY